MRQLLAQESQDTHGGRGGLGVTLEGGVGTEGRRVLQTVGERINEQKGNEQGRF